MKDDLACLVEIARHVLADEPRPIGEVSSFAATIERRIANLVAETTLTGGNTLRTTARARARDRLAALAAVGLCVVGGSTPIASGPRPRQAPSLVPCETCGAQAGQRCRNKSGGPTHSHQARKEDYHLMQMRGRTS